VVGVELDRVCLEEGLAHVNGDLACVVGAMLREVSIPHIIMQEALLGGALGVIVEVDSGNYIEPWLLD